MSPRGGFETNSKQNHENEINEMASCLKRVANDVLQGDFKIFADIDGLEREL